MNASFVQRGEAVDFVPSRDIESGELLSFGALLGIVKIPVKAGENGALHLSGIYDVLKLPESIPAGARVFWNASSRRATAEGTGNSFLGVARPAPVVRIPGQDRTSTRPSGFGRWICPIASNGRPSHKGRKFSSIPIR